MIHISICSYSYIYIFTYTMQYMIYHTSNVCTMRKFVGGDYTGWTQASFLGHIIPLAASSCSSFLFFSEDFEVEHTGPFTASFV